MAKTLLKNLTAEDQLHIFDTSDHATHAIQSAHTPTVITTEPTVTDVATKSDIIITMLPGPEHVDKVYSEIFVGLKSEHGTEKTFIDSSTIDIATSIKNAEIAYGLGSYYVDAPVSGGVVGAINGSLTFMIGGGLVDDPTINTPKPDDRSFKVYKSEVVPTLSKMGTNLIACGGPGLGLAAKLSNAYLLALTNIACSESFSLAKSLGLSLPLYSKIVASSSGRCWSSDVNNPVPDILASAPSSRHYANGFGIELMKKDLQLAVNSAKERDLPLLLSQNALDIYSNVEKDEELKDKDISVLYKYIQDMQNGKN